MTQPKRANYSNPDDPAQQCETCQDAIAQRERGVFTVSMAHQDAGERQERIRKMHADGEAGPLCSRCALEPVRVVAS